MVTLRLLVCLALGAMAAAPQEGFRSLSVDAGNRKGHIRFQTEATLQPRPDLGDDYAAHVADFGDRPPDRIVIPVSLRSEGHDPQRERSWGVFPSGNADPQDSASYNFGAVDSILRAATAEAPAVAVRLDVPSDSTSPDSHIVEAARRVAMHVNQGWAEGHGFGIREWLVCARNASGQDGMPKNGVGGSTPGSTLTAAIVDALQQLDSTLSVGHCLHWSADSAAPSTSIPSKAVGRGPHFYAWAFPETDSGANRPAQLARGLRRQLDDTGRGRAELRLLSPSLALEGSPRQDSEAAEAAARLAAALVYLQYSPVASVALDLWRGNAADETKRHAVLQAAAQLTQTPQRLATLGGDTDGYAVLAGRSDDGRALQILIANHQPRAQRRSSQAQTPSDSSNSAQASPEAGSVADGNEGYELEVGNLPWGAADFGVYVYRIDGENDLTSAWDGGGRGGSLRLRRQLPPHAIELIVVEQEDRPVYDRLPRRRNRRQ